MQVSTNVRKWWTVSLVVFDVVMVAHVLRLIVQIF